jgi:hypothetical protein
MTAMNDHLNAMAFAAEGMAGTSGASALRKVRSLADQAPAGRLFSAISTLTDMSARATSQLEAGRLAAAIGTMDQLATTAASGAAMPDIPVYLQKRR